MSSTIWIWLLRVLLLFTALTNDPFAMRASAEESHPRLKLVFIANREHYWYPHVYIYEHDGKSQGKISGSIQPQDKRLDHQPVLSADGQLCVYGYEVEATVGRLQLWDLANHRGLDLPEINQGPNTTFSPSLSADGSLLAFSGWGRAGASARWDIFLFDVQHRQMIDLPGVNTIKHDERRAALSGDGNWLAFTTNAPDGRGLTDIRLYDRQSTTVEFLPELNSPMTDSFPSLNGNGRLICFASDRTAGVGGLDVYLFDSHDRSFLSLPGLNSPGHEQSPCITHDGRFIAFVSERLDSAGEHDIFIYDREQQRLLETPELNTDRDEYDPYLIVLPAE